MAAGSVRTDLCLPLPAEGQAFADFARESSVSSQRWMSAVLATPPVLDREAADVILPSVDSFHVAPAGTTLQELANGRTQTAALLRDPTLPAFNAVTNVVRSLLTPNPAPSGAGGRKRR